MTGWQPIETAPAMDDCFLWCTDTDTKGNPQGCVRGRVYHYDNEVAPRGSGMHGNWNFSHWMPIPGAPKKERT